MIKKLLRNLKLNTLKLKATFSFHLLHISIGKEGRDYCY